MIVLLPQRRFATLLLCAVLLPVGGTAPAERAARTPPGNPTLVLDSPRGERTLPAVDLVFVFYERTYYSRGAPRSEAETGQRLDVEDRRRECRCVRLPDWSKLKFSRVRQIEIDYPPDGRMARLRITMNDGEVRELRADGLYGAVDSFAPRFAARLDEEVREFLLIRPEDASWPDEKLVRVLLKRPPPRRGRR